MKNILITGLLEPRTPKISLDNLEVEGNGLIKIIKVMNEGEMKNGVCLPRHFFYLFCLSQVSYY